MLGEINSPFIETYWQHILLGAVCYWATRYLMSFSLINTLAKEAKKIRQVRQQNSGGDSEDSEDFALNPEDVEPVASSALPVDLPHVPYEFTRLPPEESLKRAEEFYQLMNSRRTLRFFSDEPVPVEILHKIIHTAGTSPSGAHTEPWTFVLVSEKDLKQKIRDIVEEEERINYERRMSKQWTTDLKPLRTCWVKEYLTVAPYLLLVFKQQYSYTDDGKKKLHYYHDVSINLASGILLSAIHYAGLVTLTSTPLNCGPALRAMFNRPSYEKLTLLLPIGYPAKDATVPDLKRKPLADILIEYH
nr:PREDICTED: iodotyrosine deiodinase 1 [Bemisia tabaci]